MEAGTSMMTLHLPGLPHTVTTDAYSHCAFTAKVLKFAAMMGAELESVLQGGAVTDDRGTTHGR